MSGLWRVGGLVEDAFLHQHFSVAVRGVLLQKTRVALAPPEHLAVGIAVAISGGCLAHQVKMFSGADFGGIVVEIEGNFCPAFAGVVEALPFDGWSNIIGGTWRCSRLCRIARGRRRLLGRSYPCQREAKTCPSRPFHQDSFLRCHLLHWLSSTMV